MGAETKIEWADDTFNYVWGCTKVSPGCDNCYAEKFDKRVGGDHWGAGKPRRIMSDKYWATPLKWDREAAKAGKPRRVFCSSMADVFDTESPESERQRLWSLIRATPNLIWMLLTKRPHNIRAMLPPDWGDGWSNVWLGTTAEDQKRADTRIAHLLLVPARVRFLSCEPLLGPVTLPREALAPFHDLDPMLRPTPRVHWVIVGGESGPGARPMHPDWARSLRDQCNASGVPFFFKQWGDWALRDGSNGDISFSRCKIFGGDGAPVTMCPVGKKRAGRILDGRTWDELPEAKNG